MKSDVETLNPTRVRLTVEVPFEELGPSVDAAYRKIAQQVQLPGFRRGKVPPRLIDQRFGRGVVLEEAVNDALPRFYSKAVQENSVQVLGQPEVDVTEFADGEQLKFTAEVDVRPEIDLPDYTGIEVTVDDAEVTDAEVDEQVERLRERFGVLTGVDRPVQLGDFVSIDLAATVDGEPVEDGTATGLSYEVGSGDLVEGLDEAITGRSAGDATTFTTTLAAGADAGRQAEVAVTIKSVKTRELPALDDEFAQTASEFDTVDELRADIRARLERTKRMEQGMQARDRVLEALLAKVDVPLPEQVVAAEIDYRNQSFAEQLQAAGVTRESYLETQGQSSEEFDAEVQTSTRQAIAGQFVLDAIASKEQLSVSQEDLTDHLVRRAMRSGIPPEQFAQQVMESGQIPLLVNEVVRGKALAFVLGAAKVTDASGRPVELEDLRSDLAGVAADLGHDHSHDHSHDHHHHDHDSEGDDAERDDAEGDEAAGDEAAGDEAAAPEAQARQD